jgi:hypothetical protein
VSETVCPLCDAPRAPGAKRCVCNYTFEYDSAPARAPRSSSGPGRTLIVGVALVAAVAVAAWFNASVAHADASRPELGVFLIAAGLFGACGGVFAWPFFLAHRRARFVAAILGLTGARLFYGALGGALAGAGVAMTLL